LLKLFDELKTFLVLVDVDPIEANPMLGQELLAALAVRSPGDPVDGDLGHARPSLTSPN